MIGLSIPESGLSENQQSSGNYSEVVDRWEGEAYTCSEQPAVNCVMDEL